MADGIGVYGMWHAYIRAANVLDADEVAWLELDKMVTLAYLVHSKINPIQSFKFPGGDYPHNIPLRHRPDWIGIGQVLEQSRQIMLITSFDELDRILVNAFYGTYPF
jgi:hypothetical protein